LHPIRIASREREAELLASLNHSNVAGVYGLEESGGVNGDVMLGLSGESDGRNAEMLVIVTRNAAIIRLLI